MLYSTVAIDPSNIDPIKGYNTLSYLKLHIEFEYNNLLEPILTLETVLGVYVMLMSYHCWLLRSKNESQAYHMATSETTIYI